MNCLHDTATQVMTDRVIPISDAHTGKGPFRSEGIRLNRSTPGSTARAAACRPAQFPYRIPSDRKGLLPVCVADRMTRSCMTCVAVS